MKWNDYSEVQINKKQRITLPLVENNFFDKNNIPLYSIIYNVEKNVLVQSYQIKNVNYSTLPKNSLANINQSEVPTKIKSELTIGISRDKPVLILKLTPILKINGQIKKITSFTLEYELQDSNSNFKNKRIPTPIYTSNSVLSNGSWFKFSTDTTGVFRIDKQLLEKIGISTTNLDPRNIRIYGNGGTLLPQLNSDFRYDDLQENTIFINGEDDGKFDNDDFILFYSEGPHAWNINTDNFNLTRHHNNIYSDRSFYFITADKGLGKRIHFNEEVTTPASIKINNYQDFQLHEIEKTNLFANGQQWLGEDFSFNNSQSFHFNFNDLDINEDIFLRVRGAAISFTNTQMLAKINGKDLLTLNFPALSTNGFNLASTSESSDKTKLNQDQINIELTYNNLGNPSSKSFLDYIEILGTKKLIAHDKQFSFRNIYTTNPNEIYEFNIQNALKIFQVWDVSDHINPKQVINQSTDSNFIFKSQGEEHKEFYVLSDKDFYIPEALEDNEIENQNLHKLQDVDYVIITRKFLIGEAERLAEYHRNNSNLSVQVIDVEKIYNEFGSGSPDLTAIRDFIRFLYLNASSENNRIKYVCLFGDSSFDFKDRINNNNNIVPAFQSFESFNLVTSYVTDDYFGFMDTNEGSLIGSDLQDVATGRYPVSSLIEAKNTIDKTLNYYSNNSFGDWRNNITFVADDPDLPSEFILQKAVDIIAEDIKKNKPGFNIKKIYADAHQQESSAGGERYPTVNEAITNSVETGTLVVDYFGHGGINGWANERILEVPQIQDWVNKYTLPLFITVTCEFSRFDNPLQPTAGEFTFLNQNGGATNMISTTREIFISIGQLFNKNLLRILLNFQNENFTISEALMHTKHFFTSDQRFFIYNFGDPAMKLAQAKPNIVVTKMNGMDLIKNSDTLKALSHVKFEGYVTDENNNINTDFNGTLSTIIYDKPLNKTTLDNDGFGRKMNFTSIESKIFRGKSSVKNGEFSIEFIVPRDIRIAYGNSKLSFYANDISKDNSGFNQQIIIGGIDETAPTDEEGPIIKLFMNDESFVEGGNTNNSPKLYALLEDNSGINTSITAVDHDIIAILDNDNANPIVLNDYYETEINNFKKGKVKFPLRDLESGPHTIKFKCWDTYNNPSESTLSFIVVDENDLILSKVLNYPNPFINYTEFWFNHNKPNEALEVQVQIFTVSGKLIKTINQSIQSEGFLSREINWNGLDDFGNKIGKGVYVYKLKVRSLLSNIKAEKIEKLVILQ